MIKSEQTREKIVNIFEEITGFKPYPYQEEVFQHLIRGNSIILRAPTGAGKTEAVIVPFLAKMNKTLPSQMIYSLPVRTLVEAISSRVAKYAKFRELNVVGHHGKKITDPLFYSPIIVTTIDQTIGAYTCTPLSLPLRSGNIPAGAVASAFLVFDEVHTFDPERALQTAIILAQHSRELKIPFLFISATLPDAFIEGLENKGFVFKIVDVKEEKEIHVRRHREVCIHWCDEFLSSEAVKKYWEKSDKKLIVVCNTVEKAQQLYRELNDKNLNCEIILLHSRFLPEDRRKKENKTNEIFGKNSKSKGILISTQVIEVGLDISSNIILSELSPIDSLIQRAGRCARWGGEGKFIVYNIKNSRPYSNELIEATQKEIKKINGKRLDWNLEEELINKILGKYVKEWLNPEHTASIFNKLNEAAFKGEKRLAEEAVREVFSSEVAIYDTPYDLNNPYNLQTIKVHTGILRKFFNEKQPIMWKLEDNNIISDDKPDIKPIEITNSEEILPYTFYIIHPDYIKYSTQEGLLFEGKGENFEILKKEEKRMPDYKYKKEYWIQHSKKTLEVFEDIFMPRYKFALEKFANAWKIGEKDFVDKLKIVLLLHDIGKLNYKWQKTAGWNEGEEPLAHTDSEEKNLNLPPHAAISAYALSNLLFEWDELLGGAFYLALAHHHTLRAKTFSKYRFINNWQDCINTLNLNDICSKIKADGCSGELPSKMISLDYPKTYRTYAFIARILRLCDRIATGGDEDALFLYQNWL